MKHEEGEEEEGRLCGWRGGKERERRVFEELVKDCVCLAYKIESKSPPTALPLEVPLVRPLNILTDTQRKKAEGLRFISLSLSQSLSFSRMTFSPPSLRPSYTLFFPTPSPTVAIYTELTLLLTSTLSINLCNGGGPTFFLSFENFALWKIQEG